MGILSAASEVDVAPLRRLFEYWTNRRGERLGPSRSDIDPTELSWILPRLMLIDVADRVEDFHVRLMGTQVASEFGQDRTGLKFGDLGDVENMDEIAGIYAQVAKTGRPDYERNRIVSNLRSFRGYSRLLLPLTEDGATVSMIIVGLEFFGRNQSS